MSLSKGQTVQEINDTLRNAAGEAVYGNLRSTDIAQNYVRVADMEFRGYTAEEIISILSALQDMSEAASNPDAFRSHAS